MLAARAGRHETGAELAMGRITPRRGPQDLRRHMTDFIPFNRPFMTGKELSNIAEAHARGALAGDGPQTKRCHEWLERHS
eukprot:9544-Eustigmatos_ZCMA.PRE.1